MLGNLSEQHHHTAVLILSGFILLGSGISLGIGLTQASREAPDIQFTGEAKNPGEALASAAVEVNFPIDINTATAIELEELPGIGPSKAKAIVDYRKKNGPFSSLSDLMNVSGIGPSTFEKLKSLIKIK